jgi:hypothetical protein
VVEETRAVLSLRPDDGPANLGRPQGGNASPVTRGRYGSCRATNGVRPLHPGEVFVFPRTLSVPCAPGETRSDFEREDVLSIAFRSSVESRQSLLRSSDGHARFSLAHTFWPSPRTRTASTISPRHPRQFLAKDATSCIPASCGTLCAFSLCRRHVGHVAPGWCAEACVLPASSRHGRRMAWRRHPRVETGKMDVCTMGNPPTAPGYSQSLTVPGLCSSPSSTRSNGLRHVDFAFIERRSSHFSEILAFAVFEVALLCVLAWRRHFRT